MCHYSFKTICFALIFVVSPTWADNPDKNNSSYWQCSVHDSEAKEWSFKSTYERVATNKAFEACKKQSNLPLTCKAAKESCDYFSDGINTRPLWQCTALDQKAKPWVSDVYMNKDDAAIGAKAYCREKSVSPDTCYIHLVTCKNLNEKH